MKFQKIFFIFLATLLLVLYQNCSEFDASTSSSAGVSNFSYINTNIIQPRCASCHSGAVPQGGVDLSDFAAIVASGTVVAGNADASTLYTEVLNGEMPPPGSGELLTIGEVNSIRDWINNGAIENEAPNVIASNDVTITLPTSSVNLSATATDSDGTIASYSWSQVSGPNAANLNGQTSANLSASGLIEGSYVFSVTVEDDYGDQDSDTVNVTVNAQPPAPTLTQLRTNIFNSKCAGCHIGASLGGYNMDTYGNLMTQVVAGNANGSTLYTEVLSDDMPTTSNKLTPSEKDMVRDWINDGALDN